MAMPKQSVPRFDLSFTYSEFNAYANQARHIGHLVLPPIGVGLQNASFLRLKAESFLSPPEDTLRGPFGDYTPGDFDWAQDKYETQDHGVQERSDDRQEKIYSRESRNEQIRSFRAFNRVLSAYENDVARTMFDESVWSEESGLSSEVEQPWVIPTEIDGRVRHKPNPDADLIAMIDDAHDQIEDRLGGHKANTLVMNNRTFRWMIRNPRLEDLLKYDASDVLFMMSRGLQNSRQVSAVMGGIKDMLQVDQILLGRGYKRKNKENVDDNTVEFDVFWPRDQIHLCCVHNDGMDGDLQAMQPCVGRTIMWTEENLPIPGSDEMPGVIIEEYRVEGRRGGSFIGRQDRQIKVFHKEAGQRLTGIIGEPAQSQAA